MTLKEHLFCGGDKWVCWFVLTQHSLLHYDQKLLCKSIGLWAKFTHKLRVAQELSIFHHFL